MTKNEISAVLDRVRGWPPELQERLAQIATQLETQAQAKPEHWDDETRAAIAEGLAQFERGEVASKEEVEAAYARFRK